VYVCKVRSFREDSICYFLEFDATKILHLSTPKEIFEFGKVYRGSPNTWVVNDCCDVYSPGEKKKAKEWIKNNYCNIDIDFIDWKKVAKEYNGIEIWPYQWKCGHDPKCFWYYSWDCASGCIWNARIIEKVTPKKFTRRLYNKFKSSTEG